MSNAQCWAVEKALLEGHSSSNVAPTVVATKTESEPAQETLVLTLAKTSRVAFPINLLPVVV